MDCGCFLLIFDGGARLVVNQPLQQVHQVASLSPISVHLVTLIMLIQELCIAASTDSSIQTCLSKRGFSPLVNITGRVMENVIEF